MSTGASEGWVGRELKRCPFCGSDAVVEKVGCGGSQMKHKFITHCTGCKIRDMKQYNFETAAIEAWNRRVIEAEE